MMQQRRQSPRPTAHKRIFECTIEYLTMGQQGRVRAVSKLMQSMVSIVSMERLMRATAVPGNEKGLLSVADSRLATLVVIATDRVVKPFLSAESLLSWSGGHAELYTQVRQRFPSAAIGISTRLLGMSPFPFASDGHPAVTTCAVLPGGSNTRAIESVTFGGALSDTKVLALNACPSMVCLEATAAAHPLRTSVVPLSSIKPAGKLDWSGFAQFWVTLLLANAPFEVPPLPHNFFSVILSGLPTLINSMRGCDAELFAKNTSLEFLSISNMQRLETLSDSTFTGCTKLKDVELLDLPNLRTFGKALSVISSLVSITLMNLPSLTLTGATFNGCEQLSCVDLCDLPSLKTFGEAFRSCRSITTISLQNMPNVEFGNTVNDSFPFSAPSLIMTSR